MAGRHLVARMREDVTFKKALNSMRSSNMARAIETADLIEQEVVEELGWVDVEFEDLPESATFAPVRLLEGGYLEVSVEELDAPAKLISKDNVLQPKVDLVIGSRLRVPLSLTAHQDDTQKSSSSLSGSFSKQVLQEHCNGSRVAVLQPLAPVLRPPEELRELTCDCCGKEFSAGNIHWSDESPRSGSRLGFCDECFAKGPICKDLKEHDLVSGLTAGVPEHAFRKANDKNLNEACPVPLSGISPGSGLWEHFGSWNGFTHTESAQAHAGFAAHFHRSIDHKRLKRADRADVLKISFAKTDKDGLRKGGDEEVERLWTADEFRKLTFDEHRLCAQILDKDAKEPVAGPFRVMKIDGVDVWQLSLEELQVRMKKEYQAKAQKAIGKQVDIYVVHQNLIRWSFLKLMQCDESQWLDLGGGNCTFTQLRIRNNGGISCDFFADHGSQMPVSHYYFNSHKEA